MILVRTVLVALLTLAPTTAGSQGNQGAENQPSTGQGSASDAAGEKAQAGAGTVDGTTTGASGPPAEGGDGPTRPGAELCEPYTGTPVHAQCLEKVAGETVR